MEMTGKYTIGCRVLNKKGDVADGIYIIGKYGFPYVCTNLQTKLEPDDKIYVIDDVETANNYVRYLSRLYRYEFRNRAKRLGVSAGEFRYYLIKLTSSQFNEFDIGKSSFVYVKKDSHKKYQFFGDYKKLHLASIEPIKNN